MTRWLADGTVEATVLPKSLLGEALGYAINRRSRLELFLTDARIAIHNNGSGEPSTEA